MAVSIHLSTIIFGSCSFISLYMESWLQLRHRRRSGVVVSTLALINEVNLRRTRLVLRGVTVSGSIPGAGHLFQYVTNQSPKANSAFHPYGVGKWVPASAGKAKAGMVHSVSVWTRGVQVKLWDPQGQYCIEYLYLLLATPPYIPIWPLLIAL